MVFSRQWRPCFRCEPHLDLRRTGDLERECLLSDGDLAFLGDFDRDRDLAK